MFDGFLSAFALLTTLPIGRFAHFSESHPGRMFSFFPLVGLVIGIIVSLAASITFLPKDLTAFITIAVWVALTGGLHLDGLADSCDGLLATTSPERRLEIMKDPRVGSWAVIGVTLVLLGKFVALKTLPPAYLLVPPIAARWAMVLAAATQKVKSTGMAAQMRIGFGKTQLIAASFIAIFLIAALGLLFTWRLLLCLLVALITALLVGNWANNRLGGGLTGDVYGAICELAELLCLICLNIS